MKNSSFLKIIIFYIKKVKKRGLTMLIIYSMILLKTVFGSGEIGKQKLRYFLFFKYTLGQRVVSGFSRFQIPPCEND